MPRNEDSTLSFVSEALPLLGADPPKQETIDAEAFGYILVVLSTFANGIMGRLLVEAFVFFRFPLRSAMFIRGVLQSSIALIWIFAFTDAEATLSIPHRLGNLLFVAGVAQFSWTALTSVSPIHIPGNSHTALKILGAFRRCVLCRTDCFRSTHVFLFLPSRHLHDNLLPSSRWR